MKLALPLLIVFGSALILAQEPVPAPQASEGDAAAAPTAPALPWSAVGKWQGNHPDWTFIVELAPDGSIVADEVPSGHWALTGVQGQVALVLAWDSYPAETVFMTGPNEFRGKTRGKSGTGELVLQRQHR